MKTKICVRCGKEFMPTISIQKYCIECKVSAYQEYDKQYNKDHKEKTNERWKQWNKDNPEYQNQYYLIHKKEANQRSKQWYKDNPEYYRQWYQDHSEQVKEKVKQYRKTPVGKETKRRHQAKRRQLGFIPLNSYKSYGDGYIFHHFDKIGYGVYMLEEDHKSIWHNHNTGQGMEEINALAFNYLDERRNNK